MLVCGRYQKIGKMSLRIYSGKYGQKHKNVSKIRANREIKLPEEEFMEVRFSRSKFTTLLMHHCVPNLLQEAYSNKTHLILYYDATGRMVRALNCHEHSLEKRILNYACVTKY